MKPRARASFCHCPNDTSTPSSQVAPELGVEPGRQPLDDVVGSGPADGSRPPRRGRRAGPARRDRRVSRARSSNRKKSWKAPASRTRHSGTDMEARSTPSTSIRPASGCVHPGEQLDQRGLAGAVLADDRDDRAGRQVERHVVEHEPVGAGVAEGHVVEPDAAGEPVRRRAVGAGVRRGGVVLQPHQPARRVEPDAAQEPELTDGGGRRTARAGCRRPAPARPGPADASSRWP